MEITKAILDEWKRQAKKDGLLNDYEYHLGMIYPPLPYWKWKIKFDSLNALQARPFDATGGFDSLAMKRETALCIELGY